MIRRLTIAALCLWGVAWGGEEPFGGKLPPEEVQMVCVCEVVSGKCYNAIKDSHLDVETEVAEPDKCSDGGGADSRQVHRHN